MDKRKRVILLVRPTSGFHRGMLRGIWQYASVSGPWIFLREPQNPLWPSPLDPSLALMRSWKADAAICQTSTFPAVAQLNIPTIVCPITGSPDGYPAIETDSPAIARMAAEHLMELGLQHFGFCGYDALSWSNIRGAEFGNYLSAHGLETSRYAQRPEHQRASWLEEEPTLSAWLAGLPRPVGLFCANDERAAQVAECCRLKSGLRVPEDVAILGVDDDQYVCELFYPALSSVALSIEKAGFEAAALLDSFMQGKVKPANQRIIVKPIHVAQRASTDMIANDDAVLNAAMTFIKQGAGRVIQVADVASALDVSPRLLEQRFRQKVGCTVLHMIQRMRAQHIAKLLANTDRPIGDIALKLGYSDHRHIARFFSRVMGSTPQAYREQCRLRFAFRQAPEQKQNPQSS